MHYCHYYFNKSKINEYKKKRKSIKFYTKSKNWHEYLSSSIKK